MELHPSYNYTVYYILGMAMCGSLTRIHFKLQKKNNLKTEQRLKVYIKFSNGKKIITLSSAHFLRKLVMSFVMPFVGEE